MAKYRKLLQDEWDLIRRRYEGGEPAERPGKECGNRPDQAGGPHRPPDLTRIGQNAAQQIAKQALHQRPLVGPLHMASRMIHQMHVMNTGGTGRHAGQTGQTPVDMFGDFRVRRPVILQHVLDQINSTTGRIEFVAQGHISRAGGSAKSAVDAIAQNLVGPLNRRILKLLWCKHRLHLSKSLKNHHPG